MAHGRDCTNNEDGSRSPVGVNLLYPPIVPLDGDRAVLNQQSVIQPAHWHVRHATHLIPEVARPRHLAEEADLDDAGDELDFMQKLEVMVNHDTTYTSLVFMQSASQIAMSKITKPSPSLDPRAFQAGKARR